MKRSLIAAAFAASVLVAFVALAAPTQPKPASAGASGAASLYGFEMKDIDGKAVNLGQYKGKVALIVKVTSRCG